MREREENGKNEIIVNGSSESESKHNNSEEKKQIMDTDRRKVIKKS